MPNKGLNKLLSEYDDYLRFGDEDKPRHYFPSGILELNYAIGNAKGIPGGTIIQLLGDPKNGKSTTALDFIANAQKTDIKEIEIPQGKNSTRLINAAYIDFERSFDPIYAKTIGVDLSKLLLVETQWAEQSFNLVEALLDEGLQLIVVDSISMFVPQSEEDKGLDDSEKMASSASILNRVLKRLIQLSDHANALIILINQWRANMSPMARSDKKAFGARSIQYAVKATIELRRIKNEEERSTVEAYVSKTKFGPEGKKVHFDLVYGKGIDYDSHILTLSIDHGIVRKSGAWFQYGELKAHGSAGAIEKFDMEKIRAQVIEKLNNGE